MNTNPDMVDPQRRNELEEEMSRFEQEIAGHQVGPPMISANTFQMASEQIQSTIHEAHMGPVPTLGGPQPGPNHGPQQHGPNHGPQQHGPNHGPMNGPQHHGPMKGQRPMMMSGPDHMRGQGPPMHGRGPRMGPDMGPRIGPMMGHGPGGADGPGMMGQVQMMGPGNHPPGLLPTPHQNMLAQQQFGTLQPPHGFPHQMQMQPGMPLAPPPMPPMPPHMQMMGMQLPSTSGTATTAAAQTMTSEEKKEWESTYTQAESEAGKDKKKDGKKKFIRVAGGTAWEDPSLADWDPNDFRVFVGDLGNEVNDDHLTRVFSKYPSFMKAKVLRDRKSNKTKGYGFVSFKDPNDFIKAMREMNGKYIGNRPCKLRKSTWRDRNVDIVKKKQKEKKKLGLL